MCSGLEIETLDLYEMEEEGWTLLSQVASKGRVTNFLVGLQGLQKANKNQIEALWRSTEGEWMDVESEECSEHITYQKNEDGAQGWGSTGSVHAQKTEGLAGLQRLLLAWSNEYFVPLINRLEVQHR